MGVWEGTSRLFSVVELLRELCQWPRFQRAPRVG